MRHGVPGATRAFNAAMEGGGSIAGRLRTALAGVGPGFRDARAVFRADPAAAGDAAYAARAWQRGSGGTYPGVDPWRNAPRLQAGDRFDGLYPGTKGFVFPAGHMDGLALDGRRVAESAQVGPSVPNGDTILNPYRDMGVRFAATADVPRAEAVARANMQYGAGGAPEMFIPNFGDLVHSEDIIAVAADGTKIPTFVDQGGSVWIKDVDGGVIQLDGVGATSPGVWDPSRFAADRQHVLDGFRPVFDAGTLAAGAFTKPVRLYNETVGR